MLLDESASIHILSRYKQKHVTATTIMHTCTQKFSYIDKEKVRLQGIYELSVIQFPSHVISIYKDTKCFCMRVDVFSHRKECNQEKKETRFSSSFGKVYPILIKIHPQYYKKLKMYV